MFANVLPQTGHRRDLKWPKVDMTAWLQNRRSPLLPGAERLFIFRGAMESVSPSEAQAAIDYAIQVHKLCDTAKLYVSCGASVCLPDLQDLGHGRTWPL
jgi:hypothetical protein